MTFFIYSVYNGCYLFETKVVEAEGETGPSKPKTTGLTLNLKFNALKEHLPIY